MDNTNNQQEHNNNQQSNNLSMNNELQKQIYDKLNILQDKNDQQLEQLNKNLTETKQNHIDQQQKYDFMQEQLNELNAYKLANEKEKKIKNNISKLQSVLLEGGVEAKQVEELSKCIPINENMSEEDITNASNILISHFKTAVQKELEQKSNLPSPKSTTINTQNQNIEYLNDDRITYEGALAIFNYMSKKNNHK